MAHLLAHGRPWFVCILGAAALTAACSRELTPREADRLVAAHPNAKGLTPIATEGVSASSDTEAITKTRIGDDVLNLKFRRYDKSWRWEFVETKALGWLAADEVVARLQEKERLKRAATWAAGFVNEYIVTIAAVDRYSESLPFDPDWTFNLAGWLWLRGEQAALNRRLAAMDLRNNLPHAAVSATARAVQLLKTETDGWGREIEVHFAENPRRATFLSFGPDGTKGTSDDVVCLVSGQHNRWDKYKERVMWDFTKSWQLPEGLQPAIDSFVKEPTKRTATFVRVVN